MAIRKVEFTRPSLYPAQQAAIYAPERYSIIEASTKSGKTVGCIVWLAEQAWMEGRAGRNYWWVAPIFAQAKIAFRRLKRFLPEGSYTANESELTITSLNGAVIWFKGGDHPDSLYGEDVYAAVIDEASRCFLAGTLVDTPSGARAIEELRVGDEVLNASGVGRVQRLVRKKAQRIAVVTVQGYTVVSSADHRYFTQRGWIEAQHLEQSDFLITRNEAVRLMRRGVRSTSGQAEPTVLQPSLPVRGEGDANGDTQLRGMRPVVHGEGSVTDSFLQSELLREMEDAATRGACESVWPRSAREVECRTTALLGNGYARSPEGSGRTTRQSDDASARDAGQSLYGVEGDGAPSACAGREWLGVDGAATDVASPSRRCMATGVLCEDGRRKEEGGATAALSDRHRGPSTEDCNRGRWDISSGQGSARQPQERLSQRSRVDRVEVLESDDSRFHRFSDGADSVNLYDLTVSGHPSFSIHGFLVHNCKEEAWHAVRSTLTATRGAVRIIGNVKGRRNWFYQLARRAEANEPDMHFARLTAQDAVEGGVLEAAEIEDARRVLPDAVYHELYDAEASDDAGNPFGLAAIRACTQPMGGGPPFAWGWDIARSIDWSVGIGLNRAGATCAFERWNMHELPPGIAPGSEYWEATTTRIREVTGSVPGLVDSTGLGDPVFEGIAKGRENFEGLKFTSPSKQSLMEGLAVAIQQHQISFPPGVITIELEQFEYVYTRTGVQYSAPAGMHDDCVVALALAVRKRGQAVKSIAISPLLMGGAKGWQA